MKLDVEAIYLLRVETGLMRRPRIELARPYVLLRLPNGMLTTLAIDTVNFKRLKLAGAPVMVEEKARRLLREAKSLRAKRRTEAA